jgi:hypothetical protein
MVQNSETNLAVGKDLYTHDGDHLGTVKEIRGGLVKVDAPLQPDYWLSASAIDQPLGNDLYVTFTKDQLGTYKVDAPIAPVGETIGAESAGAASGYRPTTVPYSTGFTAALADDKEWPEAEPIYRQEWEREHAAPSQRWEEVTPGYRYAHSMSRIPDYRGRSWEDVEDELEGRYGAWCIAEGYTESDQDWARSGRFTREAWILIWRTR